MPPVTYFVRMIAKEGEAERVLELLLSNPAALRRASPGTSPSASIARP
jgi:hypothetical protein